MLRIRKARKEDALSLAPRLRKADRREIDALNRTPVIALMEGITGNGQCLVGVDELDVPHVIFGVVTDASACRQGFIWMMASNDIKRFRKQIVRDTSLWLQRLKAPYDMVLNAVHAENILHIRWLRYAGFSFLEKVQYNNNDFYLFVALNMNKQQEVLNV